MAVKLFVDPELVRNRMALNDLEDVNLSIESALVTTHLIMQGILDTGFEPTTGNVETFYLLSTYYPTIPNDYYRCRLKNAFVVSSSVVVKAGSSEDDITEVVPVNKYKVDKERGIVHVHTDYGDMYIEITYDAGFSATNKIPDWLVEAMIEYVPSVLNNQQATNRADEAEPVSKVQMNLAGLLLQKRLRGTAFHYRPIYSA